MCIYVFMYVYRKITAISGSCYVFVYTHICLYSIASIDCRCPVHLPASKHHHAHNNNMKMTPIWNNSILFTCSSRIKGLLRVRIYISVYLHIYFHICVSQNNSQIWQLLRVCIYIYMCIYYTCMYKWMQTYINIHTHICTII